jgi:hypothetical protein
MAQETITISPGRYFGSITALVTFEERGIDRQTITSHPVEQGAQITDHAYQEPAEATIRFGASNSSAAAGGDEGYVTNIYNQVMALQQSRTTFSIQTGKRLYTSMLATSVELTTDEKTETSLALVVICKQIIIVSTSVVAVSAPASDQTSPADTQSQAQSGTKQPQAVTTTVPSWAVQTT